jgi:hypothetical protein
MASGQIHLGVLQTPINKLTGPKPEKLETLFEKEASRVSDGWSRKESSKSPSRKSPSKR